MLNNGTDSYRFTLSLLTITTASRSLSYVSPTDAFNSVDGSPMELGRTWSFAVLLATNSNASAISQSSWPSRLKLNRSKAYSTLPNVRCVAQRRGDLQNERRRDTEYAMHMITKAEDMLTLLCSWKSPTNHVHSDTAPVRAITSILLLLIGVTVWL